MKNLLLIVTCILISLVTFSQTIYTDVVYLKNGSIIKGVIIEQIPSVSIKIKTADESLFIFKMDEIEKMTKEEKSSGNVKIEKPVKPVKEKNNEISNKGYLGILELSGGIGVGGDADNFFEGISLVNGYQLNNYFGIGIGVGIQRCSSTNFPTPNSHLPIYALIRLSTKGKTACFLSLIEGYSFGLNDRLGYNSNFNYYTYTWDYNYFTYRVNGIYVESEFGIKQNIGKNIYLTFGLDFKCRDSDKSKGLFSELDEKYLTLNIGLSSF